MRKGGRERRVVKAIRTQQVNRQLVVMNILPSQLGRHLHWWSRRRRGKERSHSHCQWKRKRKDKDRESRRKQRIVKERENIVVG